MFWHLQTFSWNRAQQMLPQILMALEHSSGRLRKSTSERWQKECLFCQGMTGAGTDGVIGQHPLRASPWHGVDFFTAPFDPCLDPGLAQVIRENPEAFMRLLSVAGLEFGVTCVAGKRHLDNGNQCSLWQALLSRAKTCQIASVSIISIFESKWQDLCVTSFE